MKFASAPDTVERHGRGLHSGVPGSVTLRSAGRGPTRFGRPGRTVPLSEVRFEGAERSTHAVLPDGGSIRTVEHLLAAVVGLGAWGGLTIEVEGPEVPLIDGCALAFVGMIDEVGGEVVGGPPSAGPVLPAWRGESFGTALETWPDDRLEVEVVLDYPAARFGRPLQGRARWDGSAEDFRARIAEARTFGALRELAALRARGLAKFVEPGVVFALDADDPATGPRTDDEPFRHKLLDVIGDLARVGPFRGKMRFDRPSHRGVAGVLAQLATALA